MSNNTVGKIIKNVIVSAAALLLFGVGVYFTICADIGSAPWDVFFLGLSGSLHVLYGTVSIGVCLLILVIDVLMREPIGIAMIIDAVVVGKTVDLCNALNLIRTPQSPLVGILLMLAGLVVEGYAQYFYMRCALGCGPRDTLLVGLKRRIPKVPIGLICVAIQSVVTLAGWLLGAKVGIGTLICAFGTGPIMQFAFKTVGFDATQVKHQNVLQTFCVILGKKAK